MNDGDRELHALKKDITKGTQFDLNTNALKLNLIANTSGVPGFSLTYRISHSQNTGEKSAQLHFILFSS